MTTKISAEVIQASVGPNGIPIHTLRLVYPRFIHSEFMTHRLFSRNAASSRAIPVSKMQDQVLNDPAKPIHFGVNQKGMQAENELSEHNREIAEMFWENAGGHMAHRVQDLINLNVHKQVVNRLLEPWQWMTVIVTATNWQNFFYLRDHKDAQPEIKELARCMKVAMDEASVFKLEAGEYHVPFVHRARENGVLQYMIPQDEGESLLYISAAEAVKVSASCSAQTSFRALDYSLDKAVMIYDKLVESKPVHASPFEHQAIALEVARIDSGDFASVMFGLPYGVTHLDRLGNLWSGNLRGWVQNRQLINGHEVQG